MLAHRPCIARRYALASFKNARLNSTSTESSGPKRVAASWGDIYIPSRDELRQSKSSSSQSPSLATRLAARKWVRSEKPASQPASVGAKIPTSTTTVASTTTTAGTTVGIDTSQAAIDTTASPAEHAPPVLPIPSAPYSIPSVPSKPRKSVPIAKELGTSDSQGEVWNQTLSSIRREEKDYFSGTETVFSGRQWIPGMESRKNAGAQRARKDKPQTVQQSDKREGRKSAPRIVKAKPVAKKGDVARKEEAELSLNGSEEFASEGETVLGGHLPEDESVLDGVSLYGPAAGQTKEEWITDLILQGRDPEAPEVQTADIELASDFDDLFHVSSTVPGVAIAVPHLLSPLQPRPAVKKGKVDFQIRRILRKYGGDYSYLQPQVQRTSLDHLPPSKLAHLALSRRPEVESRQRKTFMEVVTSATGTVEQDTRT